MNTIPDTVELLIIRTPFTQPGPASRAWTKLIPGLEAFDAKINVCDATTDFLIKGLSNEKHLYRMIDQVDATFQKGSVSRSDHDVIKAFKHRYGATEAAQALSRQLPDAIKGIASLDTTDLIALSKEIKLLDTLLSLASASYPPCRFHRHGFSHEAIVRTDDLIQFKDDPEANPFFQYAFKQWQPFGDAEPPALALLFIEQPGQIVAAATMLSAWKQRWAEIPLNVVGPRYITERLNPIVADTCAHPTTGKLKACFEAIEDIVSDLFSDANRSISATGSESPPRTMLDSQLLKADEMPARVQNAIENRQRLIRWRPCGDPTDRVTRQLYKASRQGIWNHLIFRPPVPEKLEMFAANNANIVHSYCYEVEAPGPMSDPTFRYPTTSMAYGQTKPMPGQPLWMSLKNTRIIEMLLNRYDQNDLIRLRIHGDGERLFEVGKNIEYHFDAPADLPKGHIEEIVNMVAAGGSVNTQFVRKNLEKAFLIAYVEEEGVIIGNSCLKHPREEYIDAVSRQSGIDLHNFLERGYTSVRPDYRGLGVGAKLLEGLTQRAGDHKIFSVIAETNIATQKMAIRNQTRRVATFFSQRAKKEMSVWIPEWMLPEGIVLPEQPDADDNLKTGKDAS